MVMKNKNTAALCKPFDKLSSTVAYAQGLADDTNNIFCVLRVHPYSHAAQMGMRFCVFRSDEITSQDPVILVVEPKK